MARLLLLPYIGVYSCGDWNVAFAVCSSFWHCRNAQWAESSQDRVSPLLQDSSIPHPSAMSVRRHSLGTPSLLVTVKIFTLMALCGFPFLSLSAHPLYSSPWQLCALLLYNYMFLWICVVRVRHELNATKASMRCPRNGTGWSPVKYLPLLWTYCNSSRLLPVPQSIHVPFLKSLIKGSLWMEQGCGGMIFTVLVQKKDSIRGMHLKASGKATALLINSTVDGRTCVCVSLELAPWLLIAAALLCAWLWVQLYKLSPHRSCSRSDVPPASTFGQVPLWKWWWAEFAVTASYLLVRRGGKGGWG